MYSPEIQAKIAQWRARAVEGTLTQDELKEAVALMREGRISAAASSPSAKRSKAKVAIPSVEDLERELGI